MKKVIIAGGRNFKDYETLKRVCEEILIDEDIEIVSGTANGADTLGEEYAYEKNIPVKQFKPDWGKFGRSAGFIRNEEMAKYGNVLIAFWDKSSKGTAHMIDLANKYGLTVYVHYY